MKNNSQNKAIKGRRNRVHACGPIFQYDANDTETKDELDKCVKKMMREGFSYAIIPDAIKVIYPNRKQPRFIL